MHFQSLLFLTIAVTVLCSGCQPWNAPGKRAYTSFLSGADAEFERAEAKHLLAIERLCENDLCAAEQLLRDALICDSSYGPAHNTLGKLYFDQRKYYLAAWEFEYAVKSMPERTEPLNNLGLVFEKVGNLEKAIEYFNMAWASDGDNAEYLGNLIRARIRSGDRASDLRDMLRRLIEIDHRTEWVDWARGQLMLGKIDDPYEIREPAVNFESSSQFGPIFDTAPLAEPAGGRISDLPFPD